MDLVKSVIITGIEKYPEVIDLLIIPGREKSYSHYPSEIKAELELVMEVAKSLDRASESDRLLTDDLPIDELVKDDRLNALMIHTDIPDNPMESTWSWLNDDTNITEEVIDCFCMELDVRYGDLTIHEYYNRHGVSDVAGALIAEVVLSELVYTILQLKSLNGKLLELWDNHRKLAVSVLNSALYRPDIIDAPISQLLTLAIINYKANGQQS